jgi:large subunit ribosomal protein L29
MTVKEMKQKETDVLNGELSTQVKHLFDLRTQAVTEKIEDPTQIRKTRRNIAQLKTLLHQRKLESAKK